MRLKTKRMWAVIKKSGIISYNSDGQLLIFRRKNDAKASAWCDDEMVVAVLLTDCAAIPIVNNTFLPDDCDDNLPSAEDVRGILKSN